MSNLKEKCAVFGVFSEKAEAARITYFGLFALQHRGQESSGISVSNGRRIKSHKAEGLVSHVYSEPILKKLKGHIAIGHNRYATSGGSNGHTQPVCNKNDVFALAHNGNIPDTTKLIRFLNSKKLSTKGLNDTELMHKVIWYYMKREKMLIEDAVVKSFPLFTGAFCLVILSREQLIAVRDECGIRPLSLGKLKTGGYVISSETCAINTVNGEFLRDVLPGEMIVIDKFGLKSFQLAKPNQKLDIFELIYFARPDSILLGKSVYEVRRNMGIELAKEYPIPADIVIPVPESAIPAAIGYAQQHNIQFDHGLIKNRYIGRTFIQPDQTMREKSVHMKLNPVTDVIRGKRVVVIDDSIVRGTTAMRIVKLIRSAGATQVHFLSCCPPIHFPDFYGIDTPAQKELIASSLTIDEMRDYITSDSLHFLSYNGLIRSTGLPEEMFCTSSFSGIYPINIGKNKRYIKKEIHSLKRIAVLISNIGTGTNLQAIINAVKNKKLNAVIAVVVSDTPASPGLERARKHGIPIAICPKKEELLATLLPYNLDYIALAGWKQVILDEVINAFSNRILNTHPGLIPDSPDSMVENPDKTNALWNRKKMTNRAIQNFLDSHATYAGCSNHFLTKEFDFGPVLGRCFEKIQPHDTVETLYKRLKVKENQLYVDVLRKLCN